MRKPDITQAPSAVYRYKKALYLNLTNRCPTACVFCVKAPWGMDYRGYDLKLKGEPSIGLVLAEFDRLNAATAAGEAVFCGFGESTYRLAEIKRLCPALRRRGVKTIRLNTIGLGDLICGRPIAAELAAALDSVSVSLNTSDPDQWLRLHRPQKPFREKGFEAVQSFIRDCVRAGIETTATAVDQPGVDLPAVRRLALSLGARFRLRPSLIGPSGPSPRA